MDREPLSQRPLELREVVSARNLLCQRQVETKNLIRRDAAAARVMLSDLVRGRTELIGDDENVCSGLRAGRWGPASQKKRQDDQGASRQEGHKLPNRFKRFAGFDGSIEVRPQRQRAGQRASGFAHTLGFWWSVADLEYYMGYVDNMAAQSIADLRAYATRYIVGKPRITGVLIDPASRQQLSLTTAELAKGGAN